MKIKAPILTAELAKLQSFKIRNKLQFMVDIYSD